MVNTNENSPELLLSGRLQVRTALQALVAATEGENHLGLVDDLAYCLDVHEAHIATGSRNGLRVYIPQDEVGKETEELIVESLGVVEQDDKHSDHTRRQAGYLLDVLRIVEAPRPTLTSPIVGLEAKSSPEPFVPFDFYDALMIQTKRHIPPAAALIETPEDSLNFALGLAEAYKRGSNNPFRVISELPTLVRSGAGLNEDDLAQAQALWKPALDFMRLAYDTPDIWRQLVLNSGNIQIDTLRRSEACPPNKLAAMVGLYTRAKERLQEIKSVKLIIGNSSNRYMLGFQE